MKKFKVYGQYTVTVTKEVWANDEDEAINKADNNFGGIIEYVGNGGFDKLIGVSEHDESIIADGMMEWENAEEIENDPNYFECPDCKAECERRKDVYGVEYWHCEDCCQSYNDDGEVIYPEEEEDE